MVCLGNKTLRWGRLSEPLVSVQSIRIGIVKLTIRKVLHCIHKVRMLRIETDGLSSRGKMCCIS